MTGGIGIFGAEGRAERVDFAEPKGQRFGLKLAGNSQAALLAEKILRIGVFAGLHGRVQRQGRHPEHFTRAFAVGPRQDGRMHIIKPVLIEKVVHGVRGFGTDAEGRPVLVGTGTQVRNGTQEFVGMALLLKRIVGGALALDKNLICCNLDGLLRVGRLGRDTADGNRRTDIEASGKLIKSTVGRNDDLKIPDGRAVVKLYESACFYIP